MLAPTGFSATRKSPRVHQRAAHALILHATAFLSCRFASTNSHALKASGNLRLIPQQNHPLA